MKINDVRITNWKAPGQAWWDSVKKSPNEPLIEATISMTLSSNEYQKLLDMNRSGEIARRASPVY